MKKLLIISALACVCALFDTRAQGTLNLSNLQPGQELMVGPPFAPAVGPGSIPGSYAQLFFGGTGEIGSGTALTPLVTFFPDAGATQWLVPTDFTVPGAAPGSTAQFYLEVSGPGLTLTRSGQFSSNLGGTLPSGVSLPAGDTSTLAGFTVIPEPSTIAFGVIGGLALLLRRRK